MMEGAGWMLHGFISIASSMGVEYFVQITPAKVIIGKYHWVTIDFLLYCPLKG
jgi:hypothetical protein